MWLLLILAFPVIEIWTLFKVGAQIGLANTFFALLAAAVFGIGLMRAQGGFLLRNFQASLAQGQVPSKQIFHSLLMMLSGAFFIFPGYISDVIGLFLLLPGSRHLFVAVMQKKLEAKMKEGAIRFQSFGGFGGGGFTAGFGTGFRPGPPSGMRDVSPLELTGEDHEVIEIIDVTPKKNPPDQA